MVNKTRQQRIADRIREDLSEIMLQQVSDPRLVGIQITDVTVDRELSYAEVHVSALEGQERAAEILEGLRHAQGFLRTQLSSRVDLRTFPRLRFHWDPTAERAAHIEELLSSLQKPPAGPSPQGTAEEENLPGEAGAGGGADGGADSAGNTA